MKKCKYCGSTVKDDMLTCPACGASEFVCKCNNCGEEYGSEANFCPNCGVKAGKEAKVCPECGTEYYTNACPNCGYTKQKTHINNTNNATYSEPPKKKRTWLWVLGWIFIFPVPLTILMIRNDKLNKFLRIIIVLAAWLGYFIWTNGSNGEATENIYDQSMISAVYEVMENGVNNISDDFAH